jgi:single stranded DNA-binding protein
MINATIVGNLGMDAELQHTTGGTSVCKVALATRGRRPAKGEEAPTEWVKLQIWGKRAEAIVGILQKGKFVVATGVLSVERWNNREGVAMATLTLDVSEIELGPSPMTAAEASGLRPHGRGDGVLPPQDRRPAPRLDDRSPSPTEAYARPAAGPPIDDIPF